MVPVPLWLCRWVLQHPRSTGTPGKVSLAATIRLLPLDQALLGGYEPAKEDKLLAQQFTTKQPPSGVSHFLTVLSALNEEQNKSLQTAGRVPAQTSPLSGKSKKKNP